MRKPDDLCTFLSTLKTKYNALSVVIVRYLLQHNAVLPSTCAGKQPTRRRKLHRNPPGEAVYGLAYCPW